MFGLGAGELIVIAIVALLVLGPEKLPSAAKAIGRGMRDLRRHTQDLQHTIERDTEIGDAVRELKSALRGDDNRPMHPPPRAPYPNPQTARAQASPPTPVTPDSPLPDGAVGGGFPPATPGATQDAVPATPGAPAGDAATVELDVGDGALVPPESQPIDAPADVASRRASGDDEPHAA